MMADSEVVPLLLLFFKDYFSLVYYLVGEILSGTHSLGAKGSKVDLHNHGPLRRLIIKNRFDENDSFAMRRQFQPRVACFQRGTQSGLLQIVRRGRHA